MMVANPYMISPTNYQAIQQPQMQIPSRKFAYAMGEAGAQAYPVQPGETVAIFDSTAPVLRMKTVGVDGKPLEMEVYDIIKREISEPTPEKDPMDVFATKEEIKDLIAPYVKEELEKAISGLSIKPTTKKKKGDDE